MYNDHFCDGPTLSCVTCGNFVSILFMILAMYNTLYIIKTDFLLLFRFFVFSHASYKLEHTKRHFILKEKKYISSILTLDNLIHRFLFIFPHDFLFSIFDIVHLSYFLFSAGHCLNFDC